MKSREFIVTGATLTLVAYTLVLCLASAALQTSTTISSTGTVKAVGVSLYQDSECTNPLSNINWGLIAPDETKGYTMYARNEGDYNIYLTLDIDENSWSPSEASNYLVLSWDYDNSTIVSNNVETITLSLYCDSSVTGISTFSFDTIVTGISVD